MMLMNPFALIGLAAIPALLAVYLLRNRVKRRAVSSLMLWTERTRMTPGGKRLQRNRLPLLFFLELLILLLLIWGAAGPRILSTQTTRPLTIILDNSASMGAIGSDGLNAAQRALKHLSKRVHQEQLAPVQAILAGSEPRWLEAASVQVLLQGKHVNEWNLQDATFDVESALLLARAGGHPEAKLLVVSDARPESELVGGSLRWLAAGKPLPNTGFINAVRSGNRCMLELYGKGTVQMVLSSEGGRRTIPVVLEQEKPLRKVFRLTDETMDFEASLPTDALAIDNHVLLLPQPQRKVRTKLDIRHPKLQKLVTRAIESTGLMDVEEGSCELLITDSEAGAMEPDTWILRLHPAQDAKPFTGPFVVDRASPLMDGISFEGLAWAASETEPLPGMPVVMAGNVPLLTRLDDLAGRPQFFMQLDPGLSTLQHSPAWPTLFWNLLRSRAALRPGFRETNLRPGMAPGFSGSAEVPQLGLPGMVEIEADGQLHRAAYNFLDADESDLSNRNSGDDGSWLEQETMDKHYADLAPLAIFAAIALLALHQWLLRRENELLG